MHMLKSPPALSVVLCIYNGETFLRQAIDSVLCQSLTNFELLLIDDGSTDSTLAIIRQFEKQDGRFFGEAPAVFGRAFQHHGRRGRLGETS